MILVDLGLRTYQPNEEGKAVQYRTVVKFDSGSTVDGAEFNEAERQKYVDMMNAREDAEVIKTYEVDTGVTPEEYHNEWLWSCSF
jgi:hypothetical protein